MPQKIDDFATASASLYVNAIQMFIFEDLFTLKTQNTSFLDWV